MSTTKVSLSGLSALFWLLSSVTGLSEAGNVALYVDDVLGIDQTSCGTAANPCKTISYTVNNKAQQNNNSVINIAAGTYNESIVIDKKNIHLSGAGKNLTFIVGNNASAAINAAGPAFLKVTNLSVDKGNPGIVGNSAIMQIANTIVDKNSDGIVVQSNSSLNLQGGTVSSNAMNGVNVRQNSSAQIGSSTITSNSMNGINVDMSSSVVISSSTLTKNTTGLFVIAGSSASIQGGNINSNKQWGISVAGHASVRLGGGNIIRYNGNANNFSIGSGIIIGQGSQATIQRNPNVTQMDQISLNYGPGISLHHSGYLFMVDGIVDANKADGIFLSILSEASFQSGVTITNNKGWGLKCYNDSKYDGITGTVSGNVLGQISCPHY